MDQGEMCQPIVSNAVLFIVHDNKLSFACHRLRHASMCS